MTTPTNSPAAYGPRVVTGQLHRAQRGHGKRFTPEPPPGPVRRPARVAVMLALAHKIQQAIDAGTVRDRDEVARRLGFTRARIMHLLDLTLLAPDLQEQILSLEAADGVEPISERELRRWRTPGAGWSSGARGRRSARSKQPLPFGLADYPSVPVLWKPLEATAFRRPEPERMSDEILTVLEVAALLKVADKTVYTMAQQGELPAFKVRGQWRFRRTDIDAWMASQVARTTKKAEGPRRPKGARK